MSSIKVIWGTCLKAALTLQAYYLCLFQEGAKFLSPATPKCQCWRAELKLYWEDGGRERYKYAKSSSIITGNQMSISKLIHFKSAISKLLKYLREN